ncbi:MAG: hypothetical protein DRP13_02245 [Candidatus Aenigmatarchaeota archaeon]|nr:MAG: hypothetical protein DRP13_02245 [Candidatus Aenigmarchaeota archaeon]
MYIFGIEVPLLDLLVVFSIVVVIYLIILELEFRQLRRITKRFDEEEIQLSRVMRELKGEISSLNEIIQAATSKTKRA